MSAQTFGIQMPSIFMLYRSSIGKKIIMAVTGLLGIGFVAFHMYGNLKIFGGPVYFNEYAEGLRELGHPLFGRTHLLFVARTGLIAIVGLHVWAAVSLYRQAAKARPRGYAEKRIMRANYASLTIRYGGIVLLLFVIYHLAHFTWLVDPIAPGTVEAHEAYNNVVGAFQFWPVTLFYLVAVASLGLHLYHGTWSMFQTLGINSRRLSPWLRGLAIVLAIGVPVGFAAVPVSVMLGFVTLA